MLSARICLLSKVRLAANSAAAALLGWQRAFIGGDLYANGVGGSSHNRHAQENSSGLQESHRIRVKWRFRVRIPMGVPLEDATSTRCHTTRAFNGVPGCCDHVQKIITDCDENFLKTNVQRNNGHHSRYVLVRLGPGGTRIHARSSARAASSS